jgi:hypothetical protein
MSATRNISRTFPFLVCIFSGVFVLAPAISISNSTHTRTVCLAQTEGAIRDGNATGAARLLKRVRSMQSMLRIDYREVPDDNESKPGFWPGLYSQDYQGLSRVRASVCLSMCVTLIPLVSPSSSWSSLLSVACITDTSGAQFFLFILQSKAFGHCLACHVHFGAFDTWCLILSKELIINMHVCN